MLNKKYNEAKRIIEESLKQNPDDLNLLFQLGTIYYKLNNIESSLSIMEKILKIDPNHASALNFIGYTLVEKGTDLKRGYELIKKGPFTRAKQWIFLGFHGMVLLQNKRLPESVGIYKKKAVQNTKMDPTIWEHYGDIALKLKKILRKRKKRL